MRILLAKPDFAGLLGSRVYQMYPLGMMYVAAMLQERGHEVLIYHADVSSGIPLPKGPVVLGEMNVAPLTDEMCAPFVTVLDRFKPDVLGISYTTADWAAAHVFAKMARRRGIRTVAGGIHPSLCDESGDFDAVVKGEGDSEDAAYVFETDKRWFSMQCSQPDLDRYLPARDSVIGHEKYPDFLRGMIATQRGCPYACAYCAAPAVFGTRVRTRDPAKVRAEVDALGVAHGRIIDDSFGVNRQHGLAVCAALAGSGYQWIGDMALQNVDEELAEALAAGGCEKACMGVESATPRWRELSGKHLEEGDPERALALLKGKGVAAVAFYFILGFPGETAAEMRATLTWARRLKGLGAEICLSLMTPYPGTRVWDMVSEEQRPRSWVGFLHQSSKIMLGDCTRREWDRVIEEAREI